MTTRLEIITAERVLFDGDVDGLVAPGAEGELGVLPHHTALMTLLQPGELRYRIGDQEMSLAVTGGFMEVTADRVTVLADAAEHVEEIDEARAQEAIRQAQERLASQATDLQMEQAMAAMRRAQVRLNVVRRRRSRGGMPPGAGEAGQGPAS